MKTSAASIASRFRAGRQTHVSAPLAPLVLLSLTLTSSAQVDRRQSQPAFPQDQPAQAKGTDASDLAQNAQSELATGSALTRRGQFAEAIPHLLAARGHVSNEYAASFNLALCYVGTEQYPQAIAILEDLRKGTHANADVENLLAQAYVGNGEPQPAFDALKRASALTPANEKLYLFVADACMGSRDYSLGLKAVDLGLTHLPDSGALHYERGVFLAIQDEFDIAKKDFDLASKLSPGSEISYLASANKELYAGNPGGAVLAAREGIRRGYEHPALLAVLGEALIRTGVRPGEPEFAEALAALEKSVAINPRNADAHVSLANLYIAQNRTADAITQLEQARKLDPSNPSVYASLAKAYQRHGDHQQAQDALAELAKLNRVQAEKIGAAPGDRKAGYAGLSLNSLGASDHP